MMTNFGPGSKYQSVWGAEVEAQATFGQLCLSPPVFHADKDEQLKEKWHVCPWKSYQHAQAYALDLHGVCALIVEDVSRKS